MRHKPALEGRGFRTQKWVENDTAGALPTVRAPDPANTRFATFGGFKSAETRDAKAKKRGPERHKNRTPAHAGMNEVCGTLSATHAGRIFHIRIRDFGRRG